MGEIAEGGQQPTPEMLEWLERLAIDPDRGVPERWNPTRLILHNYWLYPYQEFHFANGKLVLRGQNGAGKSTVLTTAVTLALDGDKTPARMDTFGTNAKSVTDYLVGPKDASEDDALYHEDRTAYIALEFRRGAEQRFRTIGLGVRAERKTAAGHPKLSSWYFVVRDGQRVGRGRDVEFSRHEGSEEVMRSQKDLEDVLGPSNFVTNRRDDYQHEVNQGLFGFPDDRGFQFLMQVLVTLRSPKLNKDILPDKACEMLSDALPPLNPGLLDKVTRLMDDIDATQKAVEETEEHLRLVTGIDKAQAALLRNIAHDHALEALEARDDRRRTGERLDRSQAEVRQLEDEIAAIGADLATLEDERVKVTGTLKIIRNHEAYRGQEGLRRAHTALEEAQRDFEAAERTAEHHAKALERVDQQAKVANEEWHAQRESARRTAQELAETAGAARWERARVTSATYAEAVAAVTPDQDVPRFDAAALDDEGTDRIERLERLKEVVKVVEDAEAAHERAQARVQDRTEDLTRADRARRRASEEANRARAAAAEAVRAWGAEARAVRAPAETIATVAERIGEFSDPDGDPTHAVVPIQSIADEQRRALSRRRDDARREFARLENERDALRREIAVWREKDDWAVPDPRPGQEVARRALAAAGIQVVPLYAACDVSSEADPEDAARLESAIGEAGLLDALIVRAEDAARVAALLGEDPRARADRWIVPHPANGPTLRDTFEPVACNVPRETIDRALRSIALGRHARAGAALEVDGRWRIGPVEGAVLETEQRTPIYIGETNRRREWERRLRHMEDELRGLEHRLSAAERSIEQIDAEVQALDDELQALLRLRQINAVRAALLTLRERERQLEEVRNELLKAEERAENTRIALADARRRMEKGVAEIPDARGLAGRGLDELIGRTKEVLRQVRGLHSATGRLKLAARQIEDTAQLVRSTGALLDEAQETMERRRSSVVGRRAELFAIQETLDELGLEQILAQETQLENRASEIPGERSKLDQRLGERRKQLEHLAHRIHELEETARKQNATVESADGALEAALRAYPTLEEELGIFRTTSPEEAARELLKARREDDFATMRARIEKDTNDARNVLFKAFSENQSALIMYGPEMQPGGNTVRVIFRRVPNETGPLSPRNLRAVLERDRRVQESTVRDKEDELYESFLFGDVAASVRRAIEQAKAANEHVNRILAGRPISDGWILSLKWEARKDPRRETTADYRKIVELLQRPATVLRPEQVREVKDFFRDRIAEIREAERAGTSDKRFAEALHDVLDYRRWFRYSIWVKERDDAPYEMTNSRYGKNSGAEKALAIFIPLLAAADARYRDARPDSPKLLAMDEAFNGVDADNTNAAWRFMTDMDFSWIMTSEKLWGVGPSLSACATYHFVKRGNVAAVSMWLWDGTVRVRDGAIPASEPEPGDLVALAKRAEAGGSA